MPTFPRLTSGAISQYPTQIVNQQAVQVLRYIDGSDQRFLNQGRQFRRWQIRLNLLSEAEMYALENFFEDQIGDYSIFTFIDPFSNLVVPNCVLGNPSIVSEFLERGQCATSLWVVETNG